MEIIKGIIQKNCIRLLDSDNVNISELARLTKISPSTIHKWKEGKHSPELPNIEKLASAMGISPLEFLQENKVELQAPPVSLVLKKMSAIPDDIYDKALSFGPNHEVWEEVRAAFNDALKDIELNKEANA